MFPDFAEALDIYIMIGFAAVSFILGLIIGSIRVSFDAYQQGWKDALEKVDVRSGEHKCNAIPPVPNPDWKPPVYPPMPIENWMQDEPPVRRPIPPPPDTPIEKLVRVYERSQKETLEPT